MKFSLSAEGDFIAYSDDFGDSKVVNVLRSIPCVEAESVYLCKENNYPEARPLWHSTGDCIMIRRRTAAGHPVTASGQEIRHELQDGGCSLRLVSLFNTYFMERNFIIRYITYVRNIDAASPYSFLIGHLDSYKHWELYLGESRSNRC